MRSDLMLPAGIFFAAAFAASGLLWWVYGERIYVERLLTGIANCF